MSSRSAPEETLLDGNRGRVARPHPNLLKYYLALSALAGPAFPFVLIPLVLKYKTLRYMFAREGVTMRWGALFRREIHVNYSRLQDIHLSSNVLERWLNLAKVQLQTASGSAKPEMVLEGLGDYESVRGFLYRRMHGDAGETTAPRRSADGEDALVIGLREVAAEMAAIRSMLAELAAPGTDRNGEP